jgi:YNFM family putative membrane transporter
MLSSSLAGGLAQRFGRQSMLILGLICMGIGIICTLAPSLWSIIFGIALITTGFFIAHALCSGLVGAAAQEHKGHATSLYLLFYYLGSSIIGSAGGWFWLHAGWGGIVLLALTLLLAAIGLCLIPVRPQPST